MMTSLMSIFDPSSGFMINNMCWLLLMVWMFWPKNFWVLPSVLLIMLKKFKNFITLMMNIKSNTEEKFFVSVFFFILALNYVNLIPIAFPVTSNFSFDFCLAMYVWLLAVSSSLMKKPNEFMAHFTLPNMNVLFTFILLSLEVLSFLVRPLALMLRILGNMTVGHVILGLLHMFIYSICPVLISSMLILIYEFFVCSIQAYVFASLCFFYYKEV